jgi:hypothetical protein
MSVLGWWKLGNEVHGDDIPLFVGDWERLQQGLFRWHSSHEFTYSFVSLMTVGQKNCLRTNSSVRACPRRPVQGES